MYSFFEIGGTAGARIALSVSATIITLLVMLKTIVPASSATPFVTGVLA